MKKPIVFMIIPFEDEFLALYDELKERFAESFEFINAGDLDNQQNIIKDIVIGIHKADVIIADLTGLNANVFYELGLAHAMNKKVVIITQDIGELPFDIKSYRANQYSLQFNKIIQLYSELEKLLADAINGAIQFGNPVSDYVNDKSILSSQEEKSVIIDGEKPVFEAIEDDEGAKGFLDFIADIEESMTAMTSEIEIMTNNLNRMGGEIEEGTNEIARVQATGGSGTATFIRNLSRNLSQPVDTFAFQLKGHILIIANNWDNVENSYLALLDDKRICEHDNLKGMKESVESLEEMHVAISESNKNIEGFIECLHTCLGMERRLTKAIMTLITELQDYKSMTDTMVSSIDRIILKSEIVLFANE